MEEAARAPGETVEAAQPAGNSKPAQAANTECKQEENDDSFESIRGILQHKDRMNFPSGQATGYLANWAPSFQRAHLINDESLKEYTDAYDKWVKFKRTKAGKGLWNSRKADKILFYDDGCYLVRWKQRSIPSDSVREEDVSPALLREYQDEHKPWYAFYNEEEPSRVADGKERSGTPSGTPLARNTAVKGKDKVKPSFPGLKAGMERKE